MADKIRVQSYDKKSTVGTVYTADAVDSLVGGGSGGTSIGYAFCKNAASQSSTGKLSLTEQRSSSDFTVNADDITCNFDGVVLLSFSFSLGSFDNSDCVIQIRGDTTVYAQRRADYNNDETDTFDAFPISGMAVIPVSDGDEIDINISTLSDCTVGDSNSWVTALRLV